MTQISETQEVFTVDTAIIRSLIFQQAGSIEKACIELVMNEIDAKANAVHIEIDDNMKGIRVLGDGVGFTSKDDIIKLFGRFGFSHKTDEEIARNRRYGKYGLGRAQILAFGACKWTTNQFVIEVDLSEDQESNLPYCIKEFKDVQYQGCRVEVQLNKPMQLWNRNVLERELKMMLKYTPQLITLNGKPINQDPSTVKWSAKTSSLAFKSASGDATNGLAIYNDGVFVRNYPHSQFGVSGDLTSLNTTFEVNMARNDITQSICKLWGSLREFLKPFSEKKKPSMNDDDRAYRAQAFLAGTLTFAEIANDRLVKDITGKSASLKMMSGYANGILTVAPAKHSVVGDRVHRIRSAFVVSPDWLETMGFDSLPEFIVAAKQAVKTEIELREKDRKNVSMYDLKQFQRQLDTLSIVDFNKISQGLSPTHEIVPAGDVTPLQKIKLNGIEKLNDYVFTMVKAMSAVSQKRRIVIGRSETSTAWTDSMTYIALNKSLVDDAYSNGVKGVTHVISVLIHEYCHDEESLSDHCHGAEFYQRFHDAVMSQLYSPVVWSEDALLTYFKARQKAGLGQVASEVTRANRGIHQEVIAVVNKS
jgi:hypothetical protein